MALEFLYRGVPATRRVVLFPGAWNPPTVAHLQVALAARNHSDEVIWILPRTLPHKEFEGAAFEARCRMLEILAREHDRFSAAISTAGLYVEIGREAAESLGPDVEISFVLGRDAAERIAAWDYGTPNVFDAFVRKHRLLVAARRGEYCPDAQYRNSIRPLPMDASWDEVSSSEVRRRLAEGENWSGLVPASIEPVVRKLYSLEEKGMEQEERQLVVDQLKTSRERLESLVNNLTSEQWGFQPGEGRWSIGECLEHVLRVEKRVMGNIGKKLEEAEPAKAGAAQREKDAEVARMLPDRTVRRNAPETALPVGDWRDTNQLLAEFRKTRLNTIEFAGTTKSDLRSHFFPHGFFGDLDCYQWLLALSLHGDRHAGQIEEIKACAGYPRN